MTFNDIVGATQEAGEQITGFMDDMTVRASGFLDRLGAKLSSADFDSLLDKAKSIRSMGVVTIVLLIIAVLFVIRILTKPMKLVFKLLLNTVVGFAFLFAVNFFGSRYGIGVELTWLNAVITGVFGLPGLVVLMILRFVRVIR